MKAMKVSLLALLVVGALAPKEVTAQATLFVQPPASVPIPALADSSGRLITSSQAGLPTGATGLLNSATGTIAAVVSTLTSAAAKTAFLCGLSIDATATAAGVANTTVTGLLGGTITFTTAWGASPAVTQIYRTFSPCLPASAVNTNIVTTSPAAGIGGIASVYTWGYLQ